MSLPIFTSQNKFCAAYGELLEVARKNGWTTPTESAQGEADEILTGELFQASLHADYHDRMIKILAARRPPTERGACEGYTGRPTMTSPSEREIEISRIVSQKVCAEEIATYREEIQRECVERAIAWLQNPVAVCTADSLRAAILDAAQASQPSDSFLENGMARIVKKPAHDTPLTDLHNAFPPEPPCGGKTGSERRGIPYSGYTDLAARAEVCDLVQECIEKVNAELARDPVLCHSQVRRFLVLHKELDPDDDELTRTRKVRRGFIAEKYGVLIDALYANRKEQYIETQVKFEDGRTGVISANLRIRDVAVYDPVADAA
jgi:hypothetical protein